MASSSSNLKSKSSTNFTLLCLLPSHLIESSLSGQLTKTKEKPTISQFKNSIKAQLIPTTSCNYYSQGFTNSYINLTRIRMQLSGLNAQRFNYNLIPNGTCDNCTLNSFETPFHYLWECPRYTTERNTFYKYLEATLEPLGFSIIPSNRYNLRQLTNFVIEGDTQFNDQTNLLLLNITCEFIKSTKRFY